MIGIDTNILLRLWLNDDAAQNKRIDTLLAQHGSTPESLLVTDVVLAEAVWTLRSAFDQDKAAQRVGSSARDSVVKSRRRQDALCTRSVFPIFHTLPHFEAPKRQSR